MLKVSQFQNEFMKSSFLPKYEQKRQAEVPTIFSSYLGRNDDFINSFWNCLTFRTGSNFFSQKSVLDFFSPTFTWVPKFDFQINFQCKNHLKLFFFHLYIYCTCVIITCCLYIYLLHYEKKLTKNIRLCKYRGWVPKFATHKSPF